MNRANRDISERYVLAYYKLYGLLAVSSKKDYCDLTGLHSQNFTSIEKQRRFATLDNVYMLCKVFGVSADWILFGEGDFIVKKETSKAIVNFNGVLEKALDRYQFNKDFNPEKLTDENLEKCAIFYGEMLAKNRKNTK